VTALGPVPTGPTLERGRGRGRSAAFVSRNSALIASISTLALLVLLVVAVVLSPGAGAFGHGFFWPHGFREAAEPVWRGFVLNVKLALVAEALVLVFALLIAVVRSLPGAAAFPLRALAIAYTDLFRGIPLLLVLYMVGFGVPALQLAVLSTQSLFTYGVVALVVVYSAYVAEVYRAGIESVHGSQMAAARSLSLSHGQAMRYVVLPQAVRRVVPPLLNDFIGLQKDTALVSILGVVEAAREAQDYSSVTFNFTGYTIAAVYFVLLTIPLARFTDWLIARDQARMRATGG
jgi:polar amino acid transport system permease protein